MQIKDDVTEDEVSISYNLMSWISQFFPIAVPKLYYNAVT